MGFRFGGGGWKPNSRRNRRQTGRPERSGPQKADYTIFVILGAFCLVLLVFIVLLVVSAP